MTRQVRSRDNERGSTLIVVLLIMAALTAVAGTAAYMVSTESMLASNDVVEKEMFYLAESAMEEAVQYLNELGEPFVGDGSNHDEPTVVMDHEKRGSGYISVYIDPKDTNGGQSTRFLQISTRATHVSGRSSKVLQMRVGQQNFARYAYFSDSEKSSGGNTIWFMDEDELFGPVHTNDQLHISGKPTFHEEVTSAASTIDLKSGPPTDAPDFRKGVELGAPKIELPSDLALIKARAQQSAGMYITGMTTAEIEIYYNTALQRSQLKVKKDSGTVQTYELPSNGVVYVDGVAKVKGKLAGQLTIASRKDLYIIDDVVYSVDPRLDPNSTDVLGLISEQNIIVAATQANMDVGDETIMAAIMALNTSFTVEDYNKDSPRGKLKVYGGIIQETRGAVGTFSGTSVKSGYQKAYDHDARLMDTPPPAFPTTGTVERMTWRELDPSTDISQNMF